MTLKLWVAIVIAVALVAVGYAAGWFFTKPKEEEEEEGTVKLNSAGINENTGTAAKSA